MLTVFRLGHRLPRDERITTHVALVSRALGGEGMYYSGEKDRGLEESVSKIVEKWGGEFFIEYVEKPKMFLKEKKKEGALLIHLTMYGINLREKLREIKEEGKKRKEVIVIVGGEKVPREIYEIADYNIAIGHQPHSEVAALAIFLHEYFGGKELEKEFENAKIKIIPSEKGKRVIKL